MRALSQMLLAAAALAVCACGQIDNNPLRVGTIRGRVKSGAVSTTSLALVREEPQLRSALKDDGAFEIRQVPAGTLELYVVASQDAAKLLPVEVRGGQVTDVGDLDMELAAKLDVHVTVEGGFSANGATVSVSGSPFEHVPLGQGDRALIGPLPAGCYEVEAVIPGVGDEDLHACPKAGETLVVELVVGHSGGEGGLSCSEHGCSEGLKCASDGSCVECEGVGDCASGLSCVEHQCRGRLAACAACSGDDDCEGGECQSIGNGAKVCVYPCQSGACQERGFVCDGENQCVPAPSSFDGCYGYSQMESPCSGDEVCRAQGLVNGVCVLGKCTLPCADESVCPGGFACGQSDGQMVCIRN